MSAFTIQEAEEQLNSQVPPLAEVEEAAQHQHLEVVADWTRSSRWVEVEAETVVRWPPVADSIDSRPHSSDSHHRRRMGRRLVDWRSTERIVQHNQWGMRQSPEPAWLVWRNMESCSCCYCVSSCYLGRDLVRSHRRNPDLHRLHNHPCMTPFSEVEDSP